MSRTFGRPSCGRDCEFCKYTPAHNLRDEVAQETTDIDAEVREYFDNVVVARDGSSRIDYAYRDGDWCPFGCRCDDCLEEEMRIETNPGALRVGFLELAKVA